MTFILPKGWEAKGGAIKVGTPQRNDIKIISSRAYFTHSHYPILRGLLKGWMPGAKKIIRQNVKLGDILYTAIEPNLLTTYFNSRLAKKLGLKHVFFTWQKVAYDARLRGIKLWITESIIRGTISNSAGAICGNHKAAEILKKYITRSDFKILVAPISGVDIDKFRPGINSDFRRRHGLDEKIILIFYGVFDDRKGISTLIEAFRLSLEKNHGLHLVMIGVGPLKGKIEDFAKRFQLEKNLTLIDWLPNEELPAVLADSDIFVHPSEPIGGWEEQFGYSMAEASASGLPVISTDTGSINEIVLDEKTGILIKPKQAEQLNRAILKLATDPTMRKQMGESGQRYVEDNFSHRVIAGKFYDFFDKLD